MKAVLTQFEANVYVCARFIIDNLVLCIWLGCIFYCLYVIYTAHLLANVDVFYIV